VPLVTSQGKAVLGAERAESNVVRLIALINDLLDLEKMESGNLNMEPADTSVFDLVDQSVDAIKQFADEHEVSIEKPKADYALYADPGRIVQVLVNLLSNAIKYSEKASTVRVEVTGIVPINWNLGSLIVGVASLKICKKLSLNAFSK